MERNVEVMETGLKTSTKLIAGGVVLFVGILTWIISRLLKKDNN